MLYDLDTEIDFGKYKGRTVEDVLNEDAKYLLWAMENVDRFEVDAAIQDAITRAAS
jgi:hypothetical protein